MIMPHILQALNPFHRSGLKKHHSCYYTWKERRNISYSTSENVIFLQTKFWQIATTTLRESIA